MLAPPETRGGGMRVVDDLARGLGVTLSPREGRRLGLRCSVRTGVFAGVALGTGLDASDMGGEGGSLMSETVPTDESAFPVGGGVVMRGELAVELGDVSVWRSKVGEPSADMSVEMVER